MSENGRHIACTSCRKRKIKCDGAQPRCQRCSRYGEQCAYTSPSRQTKVDVSSALQMFNERLIQAETSIAAQQEGSLGPSSPITSSYAFKDIDPANWLEMIPSSRMFPGAEINSPLSQSWNFSLPATVSFQEPTVANNLPPSNLADKNISTIFTKDSSNKSSIGEAFGLGGEQVGLIDQGYRKESPSRIWPCVDTPSSSEPPTTPSLSYDAYETVPQAVMNDLCRRYFDTVHISVPMIDKTKFLSRITDPHVPPELLGLRYSMWAHAATLSPTYSNMSERFYQQAREYLEDLEIDGTGGSMTIIALQINILLALYEFSQAFFSRAWLSVSRATWLAQMLELHKMDPKDSAKRKRPSQILLPVATESTDLEERRTTFWAAYSLNCIVGMGLDWNTAGVIDYREITTVMPIHSSFQNPSATPLTLDDALKIFATGILSPYQGMIVAITLCIRCLSHLKQLHRESMLDYFSYDFWTQHHHLDETIGYVSTYSLAHLTLANFMTEPNVLSLNIILQATIMCLHQAVVTKTERTKTYTPQAARSQNQCMKAAIELSAMVRLVGQVNLAKLNPFVSWAVYVALQVIIRRSQRKSELLPRHSSFHAIPPHLPQVDQSPRNIRPISAGTSTRPSDLPNDTRIDAQALDSINFLLSRLVDMKSSTRVAEVFEVQINQEIAEGEVGTQGRIVGLISFPLIHPNAQGRGEDNNNMDALFHI